MNERKKLQDKIASKLLNIQYTLDKYSYYHSTCIYRNGNTMFIVGRIRGERENLTMNQGDTYRRIQEERYLSIKAYLNKGHLHWS